jgi:hypothetical protein
MLWVFALCSLRLKCDCHIPELLTVFLTKQPPCFIFASYLNYAPLFERFLFLDALPN